VTGSELHSAAKQRTFMASSRDWQMDQSDETRFMREFLEAERARLFGRMVGLRVAIVPLFAGLLITIAVYEPHGWRTWLLGVLAVLVPTFFVTELVRYRRHGFERGALVQNLSAACVGQLLICMATGGLSSPFIYGVIVIAALLGNALDKHAYLRLTAIQLVMVWMFALYPAPFALESSPPTILANTIFGIWSLHDVTHAVVLSLLTIAIGQLGRGLTRVFSRASEQSYEAQAALLVSHDDRVRELTALSAEIAHELKNPLASVKGLAALLPQNVHEPKGQERLAVLRREVDRMQSILDEFLNFSRPLVPLSLQRCDAADLCREVAALHEGLAHSRRVRLVCEVQSAEVRCDPRKVQQILINLLQNALEVSPAGSSVRLQSEATAEGAMLRVLDQGPGPAESLGDLFSPGVSSKANGSGLGLTIARALARQHSGELQLKRGENGGCVAELSLPAEPTASEPPAAPSVQEAS
jgi:signal transduction histidine kinase